jgi:hypothetical protein
MKNIFVLFSTLIYSAFANNCYTLSDILNSDRLFSYKNNVYDVTGYKHPGGKSDLLKTVSVDLSIFFDQPKYKFHVGRSDVKNDLEKMYVGQLQDNCTNFTETSTTTESITELTTQSTTKRPKTKTTTEADITTIPTTIITLPSNYTTNTTSTTSIPSTTTLTKIPCEPPVIKSNSISIHNLKIHIKIFIISFLISLLI